MNIDLSVNQTRHVSHIFLVDNHSHILITFQSKIFVQICHFFGRRIFLIQESSCCKAANQNKQKQRKHNRYNSWIQSPPLSAGSPPSGYVVFSSVFSYHECPPELYLSSVSFLILPQSCHYHHHKSRTQESFSPLMILLTP